MFQIRLPFWPTCQKSPTLFLNLVELTKQPRLPIQPLTRATSVAEANPAHQKLTNPHHLLQNTHRPLTIQFSFSLTLTTNHIITSIHGVGVSLLHPPPISTKNKFPDRKLTKTIARPRPPSTMLPPPAIASHQGIFAANKGVPTLRDKTK